MESSEAVVTAVPHEQVKSTYGYERIHSTSEIRILELHPPDPHDPSGALNGNLVTAKLADKPYYEAISYVWGTPNFSETLHLPTGVLGITPNLAAALRRFRYPDRTRLLWTDAVCIDQQNGGDEKGHQVQLMGIVFKNAGHVLAWLGEGDEETATAIAFLENLANECWRYGVSPERPYESFLRYKRGGAGIRVALKALQSRILTIQASLNRFFGQEWFHRLWVVQEVALGTQVTLHNGLGILNHEMLERALASLISLVGLPNTIFLDDLIMEAIKIIVIRWSQQHDFNTSKPLLFEFINTTRSKQYSNELDSIYALLGLSRSNEDISLEANYDMSLNELLTNFAHLYLSKGDLWILQYAGTQLEESEFAGKDISSLPSWVCNFGVHEHWLISRNTIRPSGQRTVSTILKSEIMPSIGIRGTLIDTAVIVATTPDHFFSSQDVDDGCSRILEHLVKLRDLWSQSRKHGPESSHCTKESQESAFAQTLMVGRILRGLNQKIYPETASDLLCDWRDFEAFASGTDVAVDRIQAEEYLYSLRLIFVGRAFFITESGYIGNGPGNIKAGDSLVAFDGIHGMPVVLRRVEGDAAHKPGSEIEDHLDDITYADIKEKWKLIGVCYLHGFMNGEEEQPEFKDRRQIFFIE